MRSTLLLSLICVAAATAGCHDHGIPPEGDMAVDDMSASGDDMSMGDIGIPEDARQFVTFTMFSQHYAEALCARYMACGKLDAAQLAGCIERNALHTGWDQDTEIMKGRMQINELQCLDAIKASRCDFSDSGAWIAKCLQFLYTPQQSVGSPCLSTEECDKGYCEHGGSDGGMIEQPMGCPGTCAAPKALGTPCRLDSDCGSTAFCDYVTAKCAKLSALNDACTNYFGVGTGPSCLSGLTCPTFAATPTCVVPAMQMTLHGACDPYQGAVTSTPPCADGMYCRLVYTDGATCDASTPCTAPGAYCDTAGGKCKVPTSGSCEMKIASGMPCDPNNEGSFGFAESQCADGTACLQMVGQSSPSCQAALSADGTCSSTAQCKLGLSCVGGKCTPWGIDGSQCGIAGVSDCASGRCIVDNANDSTSGTKTCRPVKDVGKTCVPMYEDSLCAPADFPVSGASTSACAATTGGTGTCAPQCY